MHIKLVSSLAALSLASLAQTLPDTTKALRERANVYSTVWCGPVLAKAATKVQAEWTIPTVSLPNPRDSPVPDLEFYQWVGIDGVGGSDCGNALLQGGTSQVWNSETGAFTYDVWYEFWTPENTPSWHQKQPQVGPGDTVRVTVTADPSGRKGTVLIENLTRRTQATYYPEAVGDYALCYQHVEWVNEAPSQLLPSFPDFSFTSLSAWDANGNRFSAAGSDLWYLNGSGAQCSSTLSRDGSSVYYTNAPPRFK
ncbi:hypothetical protein PWT90_09111 [Aphanocladium album]|nr:hypothetical protein PWT90_09111 [Aphanocladium album]